MLSTITDTNIDVVRSAIKVFTELNMMSVLDDGTIYMAQVEKMIGSETGKAQRMKEYRERLKLSGGSNEAQMSLDIEIEKEKDIDIEIDKKETHKEKIEIIEDKIGRTLGALEIERVKNWHYSQMAILEALEIALQKQVKKPIEYANSILVGVSSEKPKNTPKNDFNVEDENDRWLAEFKARHSRGA